MKLLLFIGFTGCLLLFPIQHHAQDNNAMLNTVIRLKEPGGTLANLLNNITKEYNIVFSYEPGELPLNEQIKFSKDALLLKNVLEEINKKWNVSFSIHSKVIILKRKATIAEAKKENKPGKVTISGFLKDVKSGESLVRASVYVEELKSGEVTNNYGFYSLTLPQGKYRLLFSCMGYETKEKEVEFVDNERVDMELSPSVSELKEVVISQQQHNLSRFDHRLSSVNMQNVRELPALMGEADLVRNILLLPGVTSIGETGGGFQVRGGAWDQNLMLLDESIVYNADHMYGTYSVFNPDIIQDVKFYKAGIPSTYGGRASSVMDITQKNGNLKSFHGSAGFGLINSKFTFEGPIIKNKSSFIVAARRPYIDLFFKHINKEDLEDVRTHFYDINSKINFIINNNNRVYLSLYSGDDKTEETPFKLSYGNLTGTLRYNHVFSKKLFSNTSFIYSRYRMIFGETGRRFGWKNKLGLAHHEFKNNFTGYFSAHTLDFGFQGIYYKFYPGDRSPDGEFSVAERIKLPPEYGLELAVYLSDKYQVNNKTAIQYGIRFSDYRMLGPGNVYVYDNDLPKDPSTIVDTISYKRGQTISHYPNIEPRISVKYSVATDHSIKLTYNRMVQYIQQISNSVTPLPYDMWKPAGAYIKPLTANQFSLGYFTGGESNATELSFEIYYKSLKNLLEVKPGTDISVNNTIDAGLLQGIGRAYGAEILVNKTKGKWLAIHCRGQNEK